MGLGASLFLIAGGAILVWGVNREVAASTWTRSA